MASQSLQSGVGDRSGGESKVIFAGGGSGGHVYPGLAVANELLERGWEALWVGRRNGLERQIVERTEVPFWSTPALPFVGRGPLQNLRAGAVLLSSAWRSRRQVSSFGAQVVVATGGYACAPAVLAARWLKLPVVLIEPNARPGRANQWLSKWASVAAVTGAEASEAELRCPTVVTGVPVQQSFFRVPATEVNDQPLQLLVLGGSQGARTINEMLPEALVHLGPTPLRVLHQAGSEQTNQVEQLYNDAQISSLASIRIVDYVDDVATAMAWADVVVSRAGAVTLAELAAAGRASILLPLDLAGGHQLDNAQAMALAGASEVFPAEEATPEALAEVLSHWESHRELIVEMGSIGRGLARESAAADIADLVEAAV